MTLLDVLIFTCIAIEFFVAGYAVGLLHERSKRRKVLRDNRGRFMKQKGLIISKDSEDAG